MTGSEGQWTLIIVLSVFIPSRSYLRSSFLTQLKRVCIKSLLISPRIISFIYIFTHNCVFHNSDTLPIPWLKSLTYLPSESLQSVLQYKVQEAMFDAHLSPQVGVVLDKTIPLLTSLTQLTQVTYVQIL